MDKGSGDRPAQSNRKRKSFLYKERMQEKRGRFGRGTDIGADSFNYFLRVLKVKLRDFKDNEDREIFIDNVFEQTAGREIDISCNQLGSRAMETFLPLAHDKILLRFIYAFSKDLRKICSDEFGSHVLQTLVVTVSSQLQKNDGSMLEEDDKKESQSSPKDMVMRFKNWLEQVCKFVLNNLEEFVWDKFGNHIVRTVLECLSGLPPGSTSQGTKKWGKKKHVKCSDTNSNTPPLVKGHVLVEECGNCLLKMPQIVDFVYSNLTSGLLQSALLALQKVNTELLEKIMLHLLDNCYDPEAKDCSEERKKKKKLDTDTVPEIFTSQAPMYLMEVMISVASSNLFTQIYARCFNNRLKVLALLRDSNFCVQSLIRHCSTKTEFEAIFDELSSGFDSLFTSNRHGVVLALCQTCQRLGTRQGQFTKELQTVLHCSEPKERHAMFPILMAHQCTYEDWRAIENAGKKGGKTVLIRAKQIDVSQPGSLLLQNMLNFPETIKIVKAMLEMDIEHLKFLFCDTFGCHISDAFFASKTVGEKSKEKLCQKLQGSYFALVMTKHGSRALDAVWAWAPLKHRILILKDLAPQEALVNSVQWGNIFSEKSGLSLFKRRPKDWEETQTKATRTKKIFADIIGDT